MSEFNIGDKVVFANAEKHEKVSQFYPAVGTVGTVVKIDKHSIAEKGLLVDWGDAEGIDVWGDGTKSWWCNECDVKPYTCEEYEYTDDEVWKMLKPKMNQFSLPYQNIDNLSQEIKSMIVSAYRSGYGRATKGRSFIIKPKVDEKPSTKKSIDDVLGGKTIVTFYINLDDSYLVSEFDHTLYSKQGVEIHGDVVYNSDGGAGGDGFDVLNDPDCEMYVAIPFSEAMERFDKFDKAMYCGNKKAKIKQWAIGEYIGVMKFFNENCTVVKFKIEHDNLTYHPEIHSPDFKALVPIRDYLKHEGVNV